MGLGYKVHGTGKSCVVVLHSWFFDSSEFHQLIPQLNLTAFTYVFIDLRGYGLSKAMTGHYTVQEAAQDVLAVTQELSWTHFHIVGYAMSGLIAQCVAATAIDQVQSIIAVTPVPPEGLSVPSRFRQFIEDAVAEDYGKAREVIRAMGGTQISDDLVDARIGRWFRSSTLEARQGYLVMITTTNITDYVRGIPVPLLVLTGQHDTPIQRPEVLDISFKKLYPHYLHEVLASGHFVLDEAAKDLAEQIELFMAQHSGHPTPAA